MTLNIIEKTLAPRNRGSESPPTRWIWLGLIAAMVVFSQHALAVKDGDKFGDWTARCQEAQQGQPKICIITQLVNDKQSKKPVIAVQIATDPSSKQPPLAEIKTPLLVALQGGVGVKIDNGETMGIPYQYCDPAGCNAVMPLDPAMIGKLQKGSKLQVSLFPLGQKNPESYDVSLKGFTKGFKALE
jgi:invasion protein IalB